MCVPENCGELEDSGGSPDSEGSDTKRWYGRSEPRFNSREAANNP